MPLVNIMPTMNRNPKKTILASFALRINPNIPNAGTRKLSIIIGESKYDDAKG